MADRVPAYEVRVPVVRRTSNMRSTTGRPPVPPPCWTHPVLVLFFFFGVTASAPSEGMRGGPRIYSSLQHGDAAAGLSVYPSNVPLSLDCYSNAGKPVWHEAGGELETTAVHHFGSSWTSTHHIPSLTPADHLRNLTCSAGSGAQHQSTSVTLHVIDSISPVRVSLTLNSTWATERLVCQTEDLDENLQLCWYDGDRRINSQEEEEEPGHTTSPASVLALGDIVRYCRSSVTCRVQLRGGEEVLLGRASLLLQQKFLAAESQSPVIPCSQATSPPGRPPFSKSDGGLLEIVSPDTGAMHPQGAWYNPTNGIPFGLILLGIILLVSLFMVFSVVVIVRLLRNSNAELAMKMFANSPPPAYDNIYSNGPAGDTDYLVPRELVHLNQPARTSTPQQELNECSPCLTPPHPAPPMYTSYEDLQPPPHPAPPVPTSPENREPPAYPAPPVPTSSENRQNSWGGSRASLNEHYYNYPDMTTLVSTNGELLPQVPSTPNRDASISETI